MKSVEVPGPTVEHISYANSPTHNTSGDTGAGRDRTEHDGESPLLHGNQRVWAFLLKTVKNKDTHKKLFLFGMGGRPYKEGH